jgi:hypothetical protein
MEHRTLKPRVGQTASEQAILDRWIQIGRSALMPEARSAALSLEEMLEQCANLIVYQRWLANGGNTKRTAEALGIGRQRVKKIVRAFSAAQEGSNGEAHNETDEHDTDRGKLASYIPRAM